jgi:hypothetical protein
MKIKVIVLVDYTFLLKKRQRADVFYFSFFLTLF